MLSFLARVIFLSQVRGWGHRPGRPVESRLVAHAIYKTRADLADIHFKLTQLRMLKTVNGRREDLISWPAEYEGKLFVSSVARRATARYPGSRWSQRSLNQLEFHDLPRCNPDMKRRADLTCQNRVAQLFEGEKPSAGHRRTPDQTQRSQSQRRHDGGTINQKVPARRHAAKTRISTDFIKGLKPKSRHGQ